MDYLDFELRISTRADGYRVTVVHSPLGEAAEDVSWPFSDDRLENYVLKLGRARRGVRRWDSPEMRVAKQFGRQLFAAVFAGAVRGRYESSLDAARRQGKGLRLRLRLESPELAGVPWEYLYWPEREPGFLVLSPFTPLVRYVERPRPVPPLAVRPPLRVLVMASCPVDRDALDVEREWDNLQQALQPLVERGAVAVERLERATLRALRRQLRRGQYHVFHFIGHGAYDEARQDGTLLLEDDEGRGWAAGSARLAAFLHGHPSLRLAVLNACEGARVSRDDPFSGVAATLVRAGLPAVVAMQFEITDAAAVVLGEEFYAALADGCPVDEALTEARLAIYGTGNDIEWGTPVLYLRAEDGRLFDWEDVALSAKVVEPPVVRPAKPRFRFPTTLAGLPIVEPDTVARLRELPELPRRIVWRPIEMEMALVPAGPFLMGSSDDDEMAFDDEKPQHTVHLPDFYIALTPVTNAQYARFVQATGHDAPDHWESGRAPKKLEQHPVVNVSWHDALAYARWAGATLPSEAEWEKAARGGLPPAGGGERGGAERRWPWGNEWDAAKANTSEEGPGTTTPVGSYPAGASPYGVLDMAGNVWEWTRSLCRGYPYDPDDGREDLQASGLRVLRGGAFLNYLRLVRCADRGRYFPGTSSSGTTVFGL